MKVVILAAGMGRRMKGLNGDKPKSYLEFGDRPIIRHQMDALKSVGISGYDVYIVMGYGFGHILKDFGEDHAMVANHFWKFTNTAASVQIVCDWSEIKEDLIIINGDVIFDPKLLKMLVECPAQNAAIVQRKEVGDEEVAVAVKSKGSDSIVSIGKKIANPIGEAVGLYKISPKYIKKYAETFTKDDFGNFYEDIFNRMKIPMKVVDAGNLFVNEIDTPEDYEEAVKAYNKQHDSIV